MKMNSEQEKVHKNLINNSPNIWRILEDNEDTITFKYTKVEDEPYAFIVEYNLQGNIKAYIPRDVPKSYMRIIDMITGLK